MKKTEKPPVVFGPETPNYALLNSLVDKLLSMPKGVEAKGKRKLKTSHEQAPKP